MAFSPPPFGKAVQPHSGSPAFPLSWAFALLFPSSRALRLRPFHLLDEKPQGISTSGENFFSHSLQFPVFTPGRFLCMKVYFSYSHLFLILFPLLLSFLGFML